MQAGVSISGNLGIASMSACFPTFPIFNFLVQLSSCLGISSINTSRSGAGSGAGDRLPFLGRMLLGYLLLSEASCLHASMTASASSRRQLQQQLLVQYTQPVQPCLPLGLLLLFITGNQTSGSR